MTHRLRRPPLFNAYLNLMLLLLGGISLAIIPTGIFQRDTVNVGGFSLLGRFLAASLQPELSPEFVQLTVKATLTTLAYAVCGTTLSLILGIIGGLLISEVWWVTVFRQSLSPLWYGIRALFAFPRAIHEMIWGLFLINIWGLDPLVAIGAITLPFGAIVAKVFSDILDETPRQPLEALLHSGVPPLRAFMYTLIPQAFLNLLSYSFYRFECSIRSAAILGMIGAGGLGYEIFLSLQSLRYEQLWTLFYALFALNGSVDLVSAWLRHRLGCTNRLNLNVRRQEARVSPQTELVSNNRYPVPSCFPKASLTLSILTIITFSFLYIEADWSKLWSFQSWQRFIEMTRTSFPPDFQNLGILTLLDLSFQTLSMSVIAISLAGVAGMIVSCLAAANLTLPGGLILPEHPGKFLALFHWLIWLITRALLLVSRAIPAPILALVALFVLFPGILPGAIALAIHNFGILGRLMAEGIENLDSRPLQALKGLGSPTTALFLYGILPIALPRFLAYILYRWEVCLRETVIVGLVGAGGLGRLLSEQISSFDDAGVVVTLVCFIVLTVIVDWTSGKVRQQLRG